VATSRQTIDFSTPAAGFDRPLDLWSACHERVRRMIGLLQRLAAHLETNGADDEARTTATAIRRYFDEAAPRHHDDEEADLFPRLRNALMQLEPDEAAQLVVALATLETDHLDLSAMWRVLRQALARIEGGQRAVIDGPTISIFVSRYRAHMEIEESVVEPALKKLLKKADLDAIGHSMAQRRGVDWNEISKSPVVSR
jgi:pyridoxamine 5'-phosphate oxidase